MVISNHFICKDGWPSGPRFQIKPQKNISATATTAVERLEATNEGIGKFRELLRIHKAPSKVKVTSFTQNKGSFGF